MRVTYAEPALDRYRDDVTGLMEAGEPFGAVEDAIDALPDATDEVKAGLWLLAFSMRDPNDQVRDAHSHLTSVPALPEDHWWDRVETASVLFWASATFAVVLMLYLGWMA